MVLEGVVTNVTRFGAFVDVGVHQDGLVHISELSDRYVKDPADVVKAGQIVKVTVLTVDAKTKRIALSMKTARGASAQPPKSPAKSRPREKPPEKRPEKAPEKPQPSLNDKIAMLGSRWKVR